MSEAAKAAWSAWWFVNGGGIHRAWKHKEYSDIRKLAEYLPKAAWDEQQKVIDRLEADRDSLRARVERLREALDYLSTHIGPICASRETAIKALAADDNAAKVGEEKGETNG